MRQSGNGRQRPAAGGAAVLCIVLIFVLGGCAGWFGKEQEKTAAELAQEGEALFRNEKYTKAIAVYERLRDWYPYSPHAKAAELRIADAHYHLKEYEEALLAYQQYEKLHPSDQQIPYVIYQIGMCHYKRLRGIDRTQVPTKKALEAFNRLQDRFPQSRWAQKAGPKIEKCRQKLAGHEFYVGRFYFKTGHYEAALERFENVIRNYPDVDAYSREAAGYAKQARKYLGRQAADRAKDERTLPPAEPRESASELFPAMPE